jgi:hypothetical protein
MVADFPRPFARAFPTIPTERHDEFRARYPENFRGPEAWQMHDHCYAVRSAGALLLVDTGVGDRDTLGAQWFRTTGGLPSELEAVGLAPNDVDVVVITSTTSDGTSTAAATPSSLGSRTRDTSSSGPSGKGSPRPATTTTAWRSTNPWRRSRPSGSCTWWTASTA